MFIHALAFASLLAVDPRLEAAETQGRASAEATVKGDFGKLLDLTHPKIVKLMGGREAALKRLKKEFDGSEAMGLTFESCKVEPATDLHQTKDGLFCLVPLTLKMKIQGKILTKKSSLLGISTDEGKNWKFVDATNGEQNVRKLLPEIPESLKIPKTEKPVIEDDKP